MATHQKIRVKVIGGDNLIESMFEQTRFYEKEFVLMKDDKENKPDLVCFIGGADVNPKLYNEPAISETYFSNSDDNRDIKAYQDYAEIPKVGICRGGQFLNVMSGGAMWQHVDNHGVTHELTNLLPMESRGIKVGDTIKVTSTHHQMMIPGVAGEVLACVHDEKKNAGRATIFKSGTERTKPNFDTEVVWYRNTNSLCFQPHPEYRSIDGTKTYFFNLLDYFWFGQQ